MAAGNNNKTFSAINKLMSMLHATLWQGSTWYIHSQLQHTHGGSALMKTTEVRQHAGAGNVCAACITNFCMYVLLVCTPRSWQSCSWQLAWWLVLQPGMLL